MAAKTGWHARISHLVGHADVQQLPAGHEADAVEARQQPLHRSDDAPAFESGLDAQRHARFDQRFDQRVERARRLVVQGQRACGVAPVLLRFRACAGIQTKPWRLRKLLHLVVTLQREPTHSPPLFLFDALNSQCAQSHPAIQEIRHESRPKQGYLHSIDTHRGVEPGADELE